MISFKFNKNLTNNIFSLGIRLLGVGVLFSLAWVMTKTLNENWVGYYETARVVLLTVSTFGLLGTEQAILYFAGKLQAKNKSNELGYVYFQMLKLVWLSSIILVFLFIIIPNIVFNYFNLQPYLINIFKSCFIILPFYATTVLNTEVIRAYDKIILAEWFRNIFKYVPIYLGVVLIYFNIVNVQTLLNWYFYGFVVLALISFGIICFFSSETISSEKSYSFSQIAKTSYPMAISSFYTYLLMTIDVVLLGHYLGASYTAYYSIAMKIMSLLSLVIIAININYAPKIALYYERKDFGLLQKKLNEAAEIIACINFFGGIVLLVGGYFFLEFFGANYTKALPAYYILIGVQIFISFFGTVPVYMNMTGKQHLFHKILGFSVVLNVILNLIFIPKLQMVGAAISYALTVTFWNILVVYYSWKRDKITLVLWR